MGFPCNVMRKHYTFPVSTSIMHYDTFFTETKHLQNSQSFLMWPWFLVQLSHSQMK